MMARMKQNTSTNRKDYDHGSYLHLYCGLHKCNQSHLFGRINVKPRLKLQLLKKIFIFKQLKLGRRLGNPARQR